MSYPLYPEPRICLSCKFERIPNAKRVKDGEKYWVIYQCPMCKMRDIEPYKPRMLYSDGKFRPETIYDDDSYFNSDLGNA